MRHTTFRQLEVFEAIARYGSFTRAAEALYLSQPTVSMQIKKLTDTVGLPLFDQIGKKIYLTDAGKILLGTCRELSASLSHFESAVAEIKGLKKGHLRLAAITTAKYFVPRLLGPFCQQYPGIDVSLKVTNREQILLRLAENLDDLYIFGQPPEDLDLVREPFLQNPLVVLARKDHPLAAEKNIALARLAEEPFIMREIGSGTRITVEKLFSEHKLQIKTRMELGSSEAIKQAIIGGLGISVLSQHTLSLDGSGSHFAVLDVDNFPIMKHWYVAYPNGKTLSLVAQAFLTHLRDTPFSV